MKVVVEVHCPSDGICKFNWELGNALKRAGVDLEALVVLNVVPKYPERGLLVKIQPGYTSAQDSFDQALWQKVRGIVSEVDRKSVV